MFKLLKVLRSKVLFERNLSTNEFLVGVLVVLGEIWRLINNFSSEASRPYLVGKILQSLQSELGEFLILFNIRA